MKLFALLSLILIAGCGSNSNTNGVGVGGPRGQAGQTQGPAQVGFTAHAWCYDYALRQGPVQDRFMFNNGGLLSYQMFAIQNGERGDVLKQGDGQWALNGSVLQITVNNRKIMFQVQYNNPDPATGTERLHIYNGGDAAYDPCI